MNCNTFFANSAETECYNGECKLVSCSAGYHLKGNETQSECEKNTNQLCGKVNSFLTYDCTIISNSNKTCNNSGSCSCKNGYTLKLKNSNEEVKLDLNFYVELHNYPLFF